MRNVSKQSWSVVSVIVLVTMLVAAVSRAATITSANDTLTTLDAGSASNHTVVFTTPSGISEGETLTVTFDADFDTASLLENDVDVEDDGVDLTTGPDCSGAEQASVAIVADVLTIEICAGDGGAIVAASQVTVRVGTGATGSGAGSNQIVNPLTAGTYFVSVAGSFGDSGSVAIPILDPGSVSVSTSVEENGDDGTSNPVGCGDSIDPVVSLVLVSGITVDSATVSWNTDENASSILDYGLTSSYESGTVTNTSLVGSHSVTLTGLQEATSYHFRARSLDLCNNEGASADFTFSTLDETAPVIANVDAEASCGGFATVNWETDEAATASVAYGLTTSYGSTASESGYDTEHSVEITGLASGAIYHYRATSSDASGNSAESADHTVSTSSVAPPSNVSGLSVMEGDATNALTWSNPGGSFNGVLILACLNGFPSGPDDSDCAEIYDNDGESYVHAGLTNGVTYYYGVFAYDACGQFASGALALGTPSATDGEVPTCGDGVCSETESTDSCPADCPIVVTPTCEELGTCPDPACEETGTCPDPACEELGTCPTTDTCGDGICSATESTDSCPADCPVVITPTCEQEGTCPAVIPTCEEEGTCPPGTIVTGSTDITLSLLVANAQIQLSSTRSGVVRMLSNRPLRVELSTEIPSETIEMAQVIIGDGIYLLSRSDDGPAFAADVFSPKELGQHTVSATLFLTGDTSSVATATADVVPDGYAFAVSDGQSQRVGSTTATLLENGSGPWDGSPFGQMNPFTTGSDGQFGWYVPTATYALSAEAPGYGAATTGTFSAGDHIANPTIELEEIPFEIIPNVVLPISLPPAIQDAINNAVDAIESAVSTVRENDGAQAAATVAGPMLVGATLGGLLVLAWSFNLLPFLQFLFTSPFLFLWRKRRKGYGIVYDAYTKVPIELATVRLYRMPDGWNGSGDVVGTLAQTRVTDRRGGYLFVASPGRYRVLVQKTGYTFPSEHLAGVRTDGEYLDVYHGEAVDVREEHAVIAANIPLDPSANPEVHIPSRVAWIARMRVLQQVIAVSGVAVAIAVAVIQPGPITFGLVAVQLAFYLLVRRLAAPRRMKQWGIVYDKVTGRPLAHAVARVFDLAYDKLLETAVTDAKGRYSFVLGSNQYYTSYEKPGYRPAIVRPIDYRSQPEPRIYSADVALMPKLEEPSSRGSSEMTPPSAPAA